MIKKEEKLGIIGLGYVGGTVRNWFENRLKKHQLFFYDKFKKIGSLEEINRADIIFISVPTPFNAKKGYDDSAVSESISAVKNGKIIVIKSTVLPGRTKYFQKKYPKKTIVFNPEFLRAKTAFEDFLMPDKQLVGYASEQGRLIAPKILSLLPKAPYSKIIPSSDAEMVKYFNNTYLATRVIFANQIYDLCERLGANYDIVKDCVVQDKRIGNSHFDVFSDGYRGYGGLCLPKDTKSLLWFARKLKINIDLLKIVNSLNGKLRKKNAK